MNDMIKITNKMALDFIMPRHYAGRKPSISYAFGWYKDNALKAVCSFGKPASPSLCVGICGKSEQPNVFELNRLVREEDFNEPLSMFVSWCLRQLKPLNLIIVSYADTAMSHCGYIYQATNFIYTGKTKQRADIWSNKHSRHYSENDKNSGFRVIRSAKHRYVYFCTLNKKIKNHWL